MEKEKRDEESVKDIRKRYMENIIHNTGHSIRKKKMNQEWCSEWKGRHNKNTAGWIDEIV